jgi:branched-chain amino acid transport system substrate-binding protein
MKKYLYFLIGFLFGIAILYFLTFSHLPKQENIKIAVAGPMDGVHKSGKAILQGIKLYIDEVNEQGGINGKTVELVIKDDKNDRKLAISKASEVVESDDILLVLGHNFSSTSIEAGRIYKKRGVPAITGSATAVNVTKNNDWFFSVIPNNASQGSFIANYINRNLKYQRASIIFDDGIFGKTLADSFEQSAQHLGVKIVKKWGFDKSIGGKQAQIEKIVAEVRSTIDPGMIFLSMLKVDSVEVLKLLRTAGMSDQVFLGDELTSESFNILSQTDQEQTTPGYFSNQVYAVTPYLNRIGNKEAQAFRKKFLKKYQSEPLWYSATFYDAAIVAIEAIKKANFSGNDPIRNKRRAIRDELASIMSYDQGIKGVTGLTYFNKNGDTKSPLAVGYYSHQQLLPDYYQYQLASPKENKNSVVEDSLNGNLIIVENQIMEKTQIVYTGIDINRISNIDTEKGTCTADFYLWFKSKNESFNKDIISSDLAWPYELGDPIKVEHNNGTTLKAFRVKAVFFLDINYHNYPFLSIKLPIAIRHKTLKRNKLIFVVDTLGLKTEGKDFSIDVMGESEAESESNIKVENITFFQDVFSHTSAMGDSASSLDYLTSLNFSRFNSIIEFQQKNSDQLIRVLLPLLIMLLLLYIHLFVNAEYLTLRLMFPLSVLVGNAFYHVSYRNHLPIASITPLEYVYFAIYGLILIAAIGSFLAVVQIKKDRFGSVKKTTTALKIIYPLVLITPLTWYVLTLISVF